MKLPISPLEPRDPSGGGEPGSYLPVRTPCASGDQTICEIPFAALTGITAAVVGVICLGLAIFVRWMFALTGGRSVISGALTISLVAVVGDEIVGSLTFDGGRRARLRHAGEFGISVAQAYAGHQFGHFTTLGDGRAILLGAKLHDGDHEVF